MLTLRLCRSNALTFLPHSMQRLPAQMMLFVNGNRLAIDVGDAGGCDDARIKLPAIFQATQFAWLREPATTLAIGLQELELPALVTLEIIDAAFPNSAPMHLKWDLATTVKHFRQRHGARVGNADAACAL